MKKEEGGYHTTFLSGYSPQFYFHATDVTGVINLPADVKMVMPDDNTKMTVKHIYPVALEKGINSLFVKVSLLSVLEQLTKSLNN